MDEPKPPARREQDELDARQRELDARQQELVEHPRGLLGLLLWPLTTALTLGLRLFGGFVAGVFEALLPGRKGPPPEDGPEDQPPSSVNR